jgi:prefoldin alpha subunit
MAEQKDPEERRPLASNIEEFRYLQQVYQTQYMALAQEMSTRAESLRELDNVQKTLEDIDMIKERETMVPIGSDTYVQGKIINGDSVVVGIGAGFFIEKDIASAKNYISKALEKETSNINKLNKNKRELESALLEISYKIEELSH